MKIPSNMTEKQVLAAIEKIVNILAPGFKFGCFDVDDIKQEGRIIAMAALDKYDERRPLENFLYRHVKNRLINFKRDNGTRSDTPCSSCHNSLPGHTDHPDRQYCSKYEAWRNRNVTKQNIMSPVDIDTLSGDTKEIYDDNSVTDNVEHAELIRIVDKELPVELRATYLQMREGITISRTKRQKVERAITIILKERLYGR